MTRKFPVRSLMLLLAGLALALSLQACVTGHGGHAGSGYYSGGLAGDWMDTEISTIYQVRPQGNGFAVVYAQDQRDGEVYPVTESFYRNGVLQWTVHVPSTGYDITYRTTRLDGDVLYTDWWGTAGSGTEVLRRERR